jgi:hypothetical protein
METCGGFLIAMVMLLSILVFLLLKLIPREVLIDTIGDLLRDMIKAIWHFIFGAPKVRIQRRRKFWQRDP